MVDMQGRLIGKRFQAEYFVDGAHEETHGCDYLLANDIDMEPVPGYAAASWDKGYGDFVMKPDMTTLRRLPWLEGTALVLADVLDHHHHDVPHSPRAMLKRQIARLKKQKMRAYCASELEFYLFDESYEATHAKRYRRPEDRRPLHRGLSHPADHQGGGRDARHPQGAAGRRHSGRELEGRVGPGPGGDQRPLRRRARHGGQPRDPEERREGDRARRRARPSPSCRSGITASPARQSHIHASLWDAAGKTPLFFDAKAEHGMSPLMRAFVAGPAQICARHHLFPRALHQLLQALPGRHLRADQGGVEPRQPHRRLPAVRRGQQGDPHRVPHRRRRPQSLSRLRGADRGGPCRASRRSSTLEAPFSGDAYRGKKLPEVPKTLREATELPRQVRRCCARRSATTWSITTSTRREVGAVRIRPPHHRLGADARVRAVLVSWRH